VTRVSLLLPNRDNDRILEHTLTRLWQSTTHRDLEVIAVDDGSTDRSRQILRAWRDSGRLPGFRLIEKPASGVVDTLNAALEAATGEVCVQLDADASVETRGWTERMLALLECDDRVGVVTARVVMDSGDIHACGISLVDPDGLRDRPSTILEPTGRRRWHSRVRHPAEGEAPDAETRAAEVDAGIGCCMMYRRADALAAGGYDEGFAPVWFDDIDLCLSIRAAGRKVFYLPTVRVIHHLQARSGPTRARLTPRRVSRALWRRGGRRLPHDWRSRLEDRFGVDFDSHHSPEQRARLLHHYAYWREKWGWDLLNPDMDAVRERWGDTEVCWAWDPARRDAGQDVLAKFHAGA
jgi:GT2 family glycosyltransferase